jgi:CRP/FNR family transcriptional regulator, cyclic AMP receptor protein
LNETRNPPETDLDRLSRLKAFSWLSAAELRLLAKAIATANFRRSQVILRQAALACPAHILLKGIARITCQNARGERITIALLAPGLIPEFPSLPLSRFDFRCEAYNDCRVGSLSRNDFAGITANASEAASAKMHENDLQQWYRLLLRGSGFLSLGLHQRVALTLLELCSDFGIEESRGTLLRTSFSHQDIADLVGASRPRVTEHLAQLERDRFVLRQGHQFIVRVEKLSASIAAYPLDGGAEAYASHSRASRTLMNASRSARP